MKKNFNTAIGFPELCAWQPCPGIVWVQARKPQYARQLSKRKDGRRVAYGVTGGFLRTFEFRHSLDWARNLISRYTRLEMPANRGIKLLVGTTRVRHARTCLLPSFHTSFLLPCTIRRRLDKAC